MRKQKLPAVSIALCLMFVAPCVTMAAQDPLPPPGVAAQQIAAPDEGDAAAPGLEPMKSPQQLLDAILAPVEPVERAGCSGPPCPWITGCCYDTQTGCCYGASWKCYVLVCD